MGRMQKNKTVKMLGILSSLGVIIFAQITQADSLCDKDFDSHLTLADLYEMSNAVVVGTLTDITRLEGQEFETAAKNILGLKDCNKIDISDESRCTLSTSMNSYYINKTIIDIENVWKTEKMVKNDILLYNMVILPGFKFEIGKKYMIFIEKEKNDVFYTKACRVRKIPDGNDYRSITSEVNSFYNSLNKESKYLELMQTKKP